MTVTLHLVLAGSAALAAAILLFALPQRGAAGLALAAAALEIFMSLNLVKLGVAHVPVNAVLGALILVPGVMLLVQAGSKAAVSASTTLLLCGALQLLRALHWIA